MTQPAKAVSTAVPTNVDTMTSMGREPKKQRGFRTTDPRWEAAMEEAAQRDEYLSEALEQFIIDYAARRDLHAPRVSDPDTDGRS